MCMVLICILFTGARIDSAHHDNNAKRALYETLAFETAIRGALELVDASDTLVLVTADYSHSLLITGYASRHNSLFGKRIYAIFWVTSNKHVIGMEPLQHGHWFQLQVMLTK